MKNKIIAVGDLHTEWSHLNALIAKKRPKIVWQCGDFGYWPRFHNTNALGPTSKRKFNQYGIKPGNCKVYWCDGNHEDHWAIKNDLLDKGVNEIQPNVFYMKRGSTLELPDGRIVLFMGGAESIDKAERTLGHDWFPEEVITQADIENLPNKIDIVISHTCTIDMYRTIMRDRQGDTYRQYKGVDPSLHALQYIFERYEPSLWYFGHFHMFKQGKIGNTHWTALDMPKNEGRWWISLPERR